MQAVAEVRQSAKSAKEVQKVQKECKISLMGCKSFF